MKRYCATAFYAVAKSLLLALLVSPGVDVCLHSPWPTIRPTADKPKLAKAKADDTHENGEDLRARRQGYWIRLQLPIDNSTYSQVQHSVQRAQSENKGDRHVFVLEFVARDLNNAGQGTQFGDAQKLARFLASDELNGATKVAYIPKALFGHAVLVALACDQIVMGPDAKMGDAGCDERIYLKMLVAAYQAFGLEAARRAARRSPWAMLDKSREVYKVTTDTGVRICRSCRPGRSQPQAQSSFRQTHQGVRRIVAVHGQ